ncbi:MAG: DUF547 domain-containing protein [Pseudomonadota bacterium]
MPKFPVSFSIARRALLALTALAAVSMGLVQASQAAPSAELWARWSTHDANAQTTIDHRAWDRFLKRYVTERPGRANLVAYGKVSRADARALQGYIDGLAALPISTYNRPEQFAYWINLYNALTVNVVLDHYPVKGIRDIDISPGWFADGPWGKKLVTIEGEDVSLDDIEHRILRPIWQDPRIHYAVNCASIGCPDLVKQAVTADNAEAYLTAGARNYVNDPRGAQIRGGKLYVSSIYNWFEEDFAVDGGVVAHLKKYANPDLASYLAQIDEVSGDGYDWALNDAAPARTVRSNSGTGRTFSGGGS